MCSLCVDGSYGRGGACSAERCLSNYLLFENSLKDPKLASVIRMSEELKHINLETMEAVDEDAMEIDDSDVEEHVDGDEGETDSDGDGDAQGDAAVDGGSNAGAGSKKAA